MGMLAPIGGVGKKRGKMRKTIYVTEENIKVGNTNIIYKGAIIKENLLSSIFSDVFTFGTLLLSFWINYSFIHSKLLSCILLFCFLFSLNYGTKKKIVSKEEFKKIMEEILEEKQK